MYFYADDGLIASTQPERLKRAFEILTELFDRVSLWKNERKMVRMAYQT